MDFIIKDMFEMPALNELNIYSQVLPLVGICTSIDLLGDIAAINRVRITCEDYSEQPRRAFRVLEVTPRSAYMRMNRIGKYRLNLSFGDGTMGLMTQVTRAVFRLDIDLRRNTDLFVFYRCIRIPGGVVPDIKIWKPPTTAND